MTLHVNDAGIWRTIRNVYVNDNGVWRELSEIYVNDAGTWRSVFSSTQILSFTGTVSGTSSQSFSLFSTGFRSTFTSGTSGNAWLDPRVEMGAYDVLATHVSGSGGIFTGVLDTWQNLSTTRTWGVPSSPGSNTWTIDLTFRRAFDASVILTNRITITSTGP